MNFTRILVPTDGTDASLRAVACAAEMAGRYAAELIVFTAVSVPEFVARQNPEHGGVEYWVEAAAQKNLGPAVELLRQAGVGAELKVVIGPASESVVTEIESSGADLVVMGRRSRDQPKDLVLGSVSARVSRHAKVPVLLLP